MNQPPQHFYEFGPFRLDAVERLLLREAEPLPLTPKSFELLLALVERHGHIVEKQELMQAVWPDTFVEETNLTKNIFILRQALGEPDDGGRYIETVPKRGYRFVAQVREVREKSEELAATEPVNTQTAVGAEPETNAQTMPPGGYQKPAAVAPISIRPALWRLLAVALGVLLAVAAIISFTRRSEKRAVEIKSLAVLPFKPLNRSQDDEYLGIGLADAVITRLSGAGKIIVRPVSAVSKYTALDQDPLAAGREQQVDVVLDASLWRSGDKIRVTARLLDVRDGMPLWSFQCEELCTDVFAVQTLISERMAEALMPQLTGAERARLTKRYTENREANQLYLLGRYFWSKRTVEGLKKGIECFQQAVDKDPDYALAYVGLADCYLALVFYGEAPQEFIPKMKASAAKAMELDGTLAEARTILASTKVVCDWDWSGAEQEYIRAIEINPNYSTAHYRYAFHLAQTGRIEESLSESRRALELDPTSLIINENLGSRLRNARRYDEAIEQYRKTLEIDPNFLSLHSQIGGVYLQKGMHAEAIAEINKASGGRATAQLGHAYAVLGQKSEALRVLAELRELSQRRYVSPMSFAIIYAGLGEKDQTFAWMERAYQERALEVTFLNRVVAMMENLATR